MLEKTEQNTLSAEKPQAERESALSGYGEQGLNGYDLSLFRENLRRTPTERIERLQAAADFFGEVKRVRGNRLPKIHRVDGS